MGLLHLQQPQGLSVFVVYEIWCFIPIDKSVEQVYRNDHDQTHCKSDAGNGAPGDDDQNDQSQNQDP